MQRMWVVSSADSSWLYYFIIRCDHIIGILPEYKADRYRRQSLFQERLKHQSARYGHL